MNCRVSEILCFLNHFFHLKQKYFLNLRFKVTKRTCRNIKVISKILNGYGVSRKLAKCSTVQLYD